MATKFIQDRYVFIIILQNICTHMKVMKQSILGIQSYNHESFKNVKVSQIWQQMG